MAGVFSHRYGEWLFRWCLRCIQQTQIFSIDIFILEFDSSIFSHLQRYHSSEVVFFGNTYKISSLKASHGAGPLGKQEVGEKRHSPVCTGSPFSGELLFFVTYVQEPEFCWGGGGAWCVENSISSC